MGVMPSLNYAHVLLVSVIFTDILVEPNCQRVERIFGSL